MGTHSSASLPEPELPTVFVSEQVVVGGVEAVCIAFVGEFGMGMAGTALAAVLDALETHGPRRLEGNLADVEFLDAGGIAALVRCREQAVTAGCPLAVTDPQPILHAVLRLTAMLETLAVGSIPGERGLPATQRARTVDLDASAGGIEQGPAVTPMAAATPKADRLDADVADTRTCRRTAGDIRQAARQARERAQAVLVDDGARRARMRKVWADLNDSAPRAR
jgi:anti-anti-sigma factor